MPSYEERTKLKIGDMVKLLFLLVGEDETGPIVQRERMWVTVREVKGTGYVGMLESLPRTSDVLAPEDLIVFEPEHVAAVLIRKADPRHPHYRGDGPPGRE